MRRRTLITTAGAILGTSVGAAAYSQATVTRGTSFTVATDSSAQIGLAAGSSAITTTADDALDISLADLNTDSSFVYGNPANPSPASGDTLDVSSDFAFSITNNNADARDITISYTGSGVTFDIYSEDPTNGWTGATYVGTVDPSSSTSVTLSGVANLASHRVVMNVDTSNTAFDGNTGTAVSGTLKFDSVASTA